MPGVMQGPAPVHNRYRRLARPEGPSEGPPAEGPPVRLSLGSRARLPSPAALAGSYHLPFGVSL